MGEFNPEEVKKGGQKRLIAIILIAILLIGGSVAAYAFLNISPKAKYFKAEKASIDYLVDQFETRYQPEVDWHEKTKEDPTETTWNVSAEYNDPSMEYTDFGMVSPSQIINNSSLTLKTQLDQKNKELAAEVKGNFGEIEVGDIHFFLTEKNMMLGLPFLDELLQVKNDDLSKLLHNLDPETFSENESFNLWDLVDQTNNILPEEDLDYLKAEYVDMINSELSKDAFTSEDETINVNDKSLNTEKLTFHLTEKEMKDILSKLLSKMGQDKKFKDMLKKQFQVQEFGAGIKLSELTDEMEVASNEFINEFEEGLKEANKSLKTFHIPDGMTSIIWVHDGLIVKRDFSIKLGPSKDELVTLFVKGSQLLQDEKQSFTYDIGVKEDNEEYAVTISGDLSSKNNKIEDSIKLMTDNSEIAYNGSETLKDGKRDFERSISVDEAFQGSGKLIWSGTATYAKDKMNSEHQFALEVDDVNQDMFTLHLKKDAKTIKSVDKPKNEDIKDLGSMSETELIQYMETDVASQFQQWLMGLMGPTW